MFRGLLYSKSKELNLIQKIGDVFVIYIIAYSSFQDNNLIANIFTLFSTFLFFSYFKLYESYRKKFLAELIPKIFFCCCASTFTQFIIHNDNFFENNRFYYFFFWSLIYLFIHHFFLRIILRFFRSRGFNSRPIICLGNKNFYKKLKSEFNSKPWLGYKIGYWFSVNNVDYKNQFCNGGINELLKLLVEEENPRLFYSFTQSDELSFEEVLKFLGNSCIPVSYVINWKKPSMSFMVEEIGDIFALNLWNPLTLNLNKYIKRIFDLIVAIPTLFLLLPIFFIISLSIKFTSKGPIFYKQRRCGLRGKIFEIYKFRTLKDEVANQIKMIEQVKVNDKRITKVGAILRKYSLDELPQLVNVIKGEMSLVGPRPHAIQHNEYYRKLITGYMQRHSRIPGITGLAQINGARGETSKIEMMQLRVDYDLEYNNNWNLWKDIKILFSTILLVSRGDAN